ncbi:MAG TPA: aminoglycoside phosphotransferase family protein [Mycobacteriales bacterium]|nr:aminoglycoside phosphotransferase family protein [Mycobacteriales bacterium]
MSIRVPPDLARTVGETWGARGERWLADLPCLTAAIADDWGLDVGPPFDLSYHWVCSATRSDGRQAVLKLGPAWPGHLAIEAATLGIFDGHGAVRLLASDTARGALLLERAQPGTPATALVGHHDEDATAAAVRLMRMLNVPPPPGCPLPALAEERASFAGYLRDHPGDSPLPRYLVERAGSLFDELCASAPGQAVLHGDLHHENILRATREPWLAIDPHGVVGDRGYEIGALLYNPEPTRRDDSLLALVPARIEQLADGLRLPIERVVAWGFVKAVLSEVWDAEGGDEPGGRALDVALHLLPRLP